MHSIETATFFIEPRILRRVIRLDRRIQGFHLLVPHRECYTVDRDRLFALVDPYELGIEEDPELPPRLILLPHGDEEELGDGAVVQSERVRRRMFHGAVHWHLEMTLGRSDTFQAVAEERRKQIGEIEFSEIRDVLSNDEYLFQSPSDFETYVEFAAVYLELRYFAPYALPCYFPAIRDFKAINRVIRQDLDPQELFSRLPKAARTSRSPAPPGPPVGRPFSRVRDLDVRSFWPPGQRPDSLQVQRPQGSGPELALRVPRLTDPAATAVHPAAAEAAAMASSAAPEDAVRRASEYELLAAKARRAAELGNSVKAILAGFGAAAVAPPEQRADAEALAHRDLLDFAQRLQRMLQLPPDGEVAELAQTLQPLLEPARARAFSTEARLLYDLQKACIASEQEIRRIDLVQWVLHRGKRPLERSLPSLSEALVLRHLKTACRRVGAADIAPSDRDTLSDLLHHAMQAREAQSRQRLRGQIAEVFAQVGIQMQNVPERVAAQKVTEELIDRILERSYLRMGDVRDTLSKNDLKLPDVTSISDVVAGDRLLQADRRLDVALDGIYRRGAIYQRLPQMLSSLAFGTAIGRFLTLYLVVPYGGAFLTLECLKHLGLLPGVDAPDTHHLMEAEEPLPVVETPTDWWFIGVVLALGTWVLLLIARPSFRQWNSRVLRGGGRAARGLLIDLPTQLLRSSFVQRVLASYAYAVLRDYLLRPGLLTALLWLGSVGLDHRWSDRLTFEVFLVVALFLNSSLGTIVAEWLTHFLVRLWHNVRFRVFASVLQWINELFRGLLMTVERMVYAIDEWLRFRSGDSPVMQTLKLAGGVIWFVVAYLVVFIFTLLVEPQINPIKHFPVVTVSHKLLLPTGPVIVQELTPYLGRARAHTVVWTTIWLIPGIFGYLVWELKENWRLYAANRSRRLRAEAIGNHGETMLRLLRPGFHSGTVPKAFAALRRAARKAATADDPQLHRRWSAVRHIEAEVVRFVDRQLISLLREIGLLSRVPIAIRGVQISVHRIEVALAGEVAEQEPLVLVWAYRDGVITGATSAPPWIEQLDSHQRKSLKFAIAGLFQRSGVETVTGPLATGDALAITWEDWVETWRNARRG